MDKANGNRGVEHPIPTDMALIGSTEQALHTQSLPRLTGPNFGYGQVTSGSEERNQGGKGPNG